MLISAIVNVAQHTTNNEEALPWVLARRGVLTCLFLCLVAKLREVT